MATQHYQISGMHCQSCVRKVQQALQAHAPQVSVQLASAQVSLSDDARPAANWDVATLNDSLRAIGDYQLSPLLPASSASQSKPLASESASESRLSWWQTYRPLLILLSYLVMVTLLLEWRAGSWSSTRWMQHFMAAFFLLFSFFKMLDLSAFAHTYARYDLLAKRVLAYGYLYPFIELSLGIAYLLGWHLQQAHLITLLVMGFSSLGVLQSVLQRQSIRCACLGAVFNLPMSVVTVIEDFTMVAMAAYMLWVH